MEGLWRVDYPQMDLLAMAVAVYRYKDEGGIAVTTYVFRLDNAVPKLLYRVTFRVLARLQLASCWPRGNYCMPRGCL